MRFAWDNIPYYRSRMHAAGVQPKDIQNAADLPKLPLIDKLELTLHPEKFMPPGAEDRDGLTLLSSGTSGYRRRFRHDRHSILSALAAGRRYRLALRHFLGREGGYREAVINRPGHAGEQIRAFIESRTLRPPGLELQRTYLDPGLPFPDLLAHLQDFRPDLIRGIGSHLGAFFRWVHENNLRLAAPRAVTYGADTMPQRDRELIEKDLGIPVLSSYQAVEALRIGFECEARQGFHLFTDQVAVRVVDPAGRDVRPGEAGELVLTNLANRATVVINYRLGDQVRWSVGLCPCGRTLPRLASIEGRLDDLIARRDGSRLPALVVLPVLQALPGIAQLQIEQFDFDSFLLRIRPSGPTPPARELIESTLTRLLGGPLQIQIETVSTLPREASAKMKTFISRVPLA